MDSIADRFLGHVFKKNVDSYLQSLDSSDVRTVEDIIQYNNEHTDEELPSGRYLIYQKCSDSG